MSFQFRGPDSKGRDLGYIIGCWMHNARIMNRHSWINNDDWSDYYKHHVIQLLAQSYIKIICDDKDPSFILGFMVYQFDINNHLAVHFIYVGHDYQRFGVAASLIENVYPDSLNKPIVAMSYTKDLPDHWMKKYSKLRFNPYAVLTKKVP